MFVKGANFLMKDEYHKGLRNGFNADKNILGSYFKFGARSTKCNLAKTRCSLRVGAPLADASL